MAIETKAGQKTGFYLPKDTFCNVVPDANGSGLVCQYNDGVLTNKYQVYAGSTFSIGPFNEDTTLEISAITGSAHHLMNQFVDYVVTNINAL